MNITRKAPIFFLLLVCLLATFTSCCNSMPLSVQKRWIMDDATGKRMKLHCAHWVAHIKPMLAEGLNKLPLNNITAKVADAGFNCVRLSYATYMFTRHANETIVHTLYSLDIPEIVSAIEQHNPWVLNMTHLQAYEAVIDALGARGIMVLIDDHVSLPEWCCSNDDQNGFFGDRHFNPHEWLQGLAFIARYFKGKPNVFAMDLRNELRGSRQNVLDWHKYMSQGAKTIHEINPDLLVIVSGLNFDNDLSFLKKKGLDLNFTNKIVYEAHIYSFSGDQGRWNEQPVNRICNAMLKTLNEQSAFLMSGKNPVPLFISEFGYDETLGNSVDNKYLPCFVSFAASVDLDWSLWAFGGSYYYKQGQIDVGEWYGVMDDDWKNYRDPNFLQKFQLIERKLQDPTSNVSKTHIMFHPLSGNCVHVNNSNEIVMGDCKSNSLWSAEGEGSPIRLMDSDLCLKAVGEGLSPTLSKDCLSPQSSWKAVSVTGLHLASFDKDGSLLCLDRDSNSTKIVTRKCICIDDYDSSCLDNPQSQWFQLVTTNV
ncbi:glycosyl hydrolase 5 family protein-like [Abrus precatorius]|uniref:Glycosyl hydrolase 5 family protein-like n=1 Tax=Abrus precatorius TaxID=3816 RepID=A0A8B8KWY4_ABRPR|nr:glycosyl hydrolase 5 family protein-like [Abrus precatorius]